MATSLVQGEMDILSCWLLFIASRFPHFIISPSIITKQKGKKYQGVRATKTFEYKNTRSDFNSCYYCEKWKTLSDYRDTRVPQATVPDKVTPDIDGFNDEPVV